MQLTSDPSDSPVSTAPRPSPTDLRSVIADDDRFRAWYEAVLPRVYRYVASRCGGDVALAEEVTQQTFTDAIRRASSFDGRSDVVTWLCAIARNKLVDNHRRRQREQRRHLFLIDRSASVGDRAWGSVEMKLAVEAALTQLPSDQRLALLFRYLDGLSVREVAALLRRTEKATESLLSRAREGFRRVYGDHADAR